jgi:hypothetical protein
MRSRFCALVRDQLGAFVDGELTGAERLDVSQHIQVCQRCAAEVEELTAIGEALRETVDVMVLPTSDLAGLAAGVVSRTRAEAALSWQGRLRRASQDRHWLMVACGAFAATVVCFMALSALLAFGPEPERQDSLAAYLETPGVELAFVDTTLPHVVRLASTNAVSRGSGRDDYELQETRLVEELAFRVNRLGALSHADPTSRLIQESLLDDILRLRLDEPTLVGRPAAESIRVSTAFSAHRPALYVAQ